LLIVNVNSSVKIGAETWEKEAMATGGRLAISKPKVLVQKI